MATKQDVYTKVDMSYKNHPLKIAYDIESEPDLFTLAMIHDKAFTLMFFGNSQFDDVTEEYLKDRTYQFVKKPGTLRDMNINSAEDVNINILKYQMGNKKDMKRLNRDLQNMIICKPLDCDKRHIVPENVDQFVEYYGWNSANYDLHMIILVYLLAKSEKENLTPQLIRDMSNLLISYHGSPFKLPYYLEEKSANKVKADRFKYTKNLALWSDGHIDCAKLAKQDANGEEAMVPPGLKKEMARFGMDIIIDDSVANDESRIWTDEEKETLVDYNFNDVLGTKVISELDLIVESLRSRDKIREMRSYTAARFTPMDKLNKWEPEARDATAARVSGLTLIGPRRIKPEDWDKVQFRFPIPLNDGSGEKEFMDLWDKMKRTEAFVPEQLDQFFSHFKNKDTRTHWDMKKVVNSQPINHKSALNIPYYRDGKPQDAYIRVSTGGAHGSVCANLSNKNEAEIKEWSISDIGATELNKPTIDQQDIVHIDWSSFYPVLCSLMEIYKTKEDVDRYTEIIGERFKQKDLLPQLFKKLNEAKTEEEKEKINAQITDSHQMVAGLKFILNNATGAGNTRTPWALLPVDNKTLSMRLVGNMHIWCLGQRLTQAGAYVISTNTDGLYVCNLTVEECQEVIDDYVYEYGMGVDPEPIKRFINRDTSNRIEFNNDEHKVDLVKGLLTHGQFLSFVSNVSIGKNVSYPLVSCYAAIKYMSDDADWLDKPYDSKRLRQILEDIHQDPETPRHAWYHIYSSTSSRKLLYDGEVQQKINRVIFTNSGKQINDKKNQQFSKSISHFLARQFQLNHNLLKDDVKPYDTDVETEKMEFSGQISKEGFDFDNAEIDFVYKVTQDDGSEEWLPHGADIYDESLIMKFKELGDSEEEVKANKDLPEEASKYKILGYRLLNEEIPQWRPFKRWKLSNITNYTSNVGEIINTREQLETFDIEDLNIDAYFEWAENILSNWKVTANIPEINLFSRDDTVNKVTQPKKKQTKKDVQIQILRSFYFPEEQKEQI